MTPTNTAAEGSTGPIAESAWGVDIRDRSVVALRVGYGPDSDRLVALEFGRVSRSAVDHLTPDDPEGWIAHALTALDRAHDLRTVPVAVALRGRAGMLRIFDLPRLDEKKLAKIMNFEVKNRVHPLEPKDVTWQHQHLWSDPDAADDGLGDGVALFIARNDQIDATMRPFEAAGLEVDLIQMHAAALANYVDFEHPGAGEANAKLAVIDVGDESTGMVLTDGARVWNRNIPIGGDHFLRALAAGAKSSLAEAERAERTAIKGRPARPAPAEVVAVRDEMRAEIRRCAGYLSSVSGPGKVRRVVALGEGCRLATCRDLVREALGAVDLVYPGPPTRLDQADALRAGSFRGHASSSAAAQGLALQALGSGRVSANLLPPQRRALRSRPRGSSLFRLVRSLIFR